MSRPVRRRVGDHPDQGPSSSRMLVLTLLAMKSSDVVGQHARARASAFLRRIAMRGLEVGRLDVGDQAPLEAASAAAPRASGSRCGGRSLVITICFCASCSALKVWKNSSCVRSLPARNWMSSISSTSTSRYFCAELGQPVWCGSR